MKKTTLLVLAMLTLVSSTLCQEPTYEQTQKWVVFKIREGGGAKITYSGGDYMTESYPEASMDDCKLRWTTVLFGSGLRIVGKGASVTNTTDSIPLDKVSSVQVTHNPSGYVVKISTSGKVITSTSVKKQGDTVVSQDVSTLDWDSISFGRSPDTDQDTADRMQKALTHAVSLCTKTKGKEPF